MAILLGGLTGLGVVFLLHSGGALWAWGVLVVGAGLSIRWFIRRRRL